MSQTENKQEQPKPTSLLRRRSVRIILLCLALLIALVAALPLIVSHGLGQTILLWACNKQLNSSSSVEKVSMDWSGGMVLENLRLDQPTGFGAGPAVTVKRIEMDMALTEIVLGRCKITGRVTGLQINAVRDEKGRLNLTHLVPAKVIRKSKPSKGKPGQSTPGSTLPIWLNLALENAQIRIVDRIQGLTGHLSMTASIANKGYDTPLHAKGDMALSLDETSTTAGCINWNGTIHPKNDDIRLKVIGEKINLAAWEPLLPLGQEISNLAGLANLSFDITASKKECSARYTVSLLNPKASIKSLGSPPLRLDEITFSGNGALPANAKFPTITNFQLACGPLTASQLPQAEAKKLLGDKTGNAIAFHLNLNELPDHPGLLPAGSEMGGSLTIETGIPDDLTDQGLNFTLKGKDIRFKDKQVNAGPISLNGNGKLTDLDDPLTALTAEINLLLNSLQSVYGQLQETSIQLNCSKGKLDLELIKAQLNKGTATGKINIALLEKQQPFKATINLGNSQLTENVAPLVAYFLPFAVATDDARLSGTASLFTSISGNLAEFNLPTLLSSLQGDGSLTCNELIFRGNPALETILSTFRAQNRHIIKNLNTNFRIADLCLHQDGIKITHKGTPLVIKGSTSFNGDLNYTFDYSKLLEKHKDGRKLLAILGANALPLKLEGTLANPKIKTKALDLNTLLDKGKKDLRKKAEKELDRAIKKGLKKLFGK